MVNLITQLLSATTNGAVDRILNENLYKVPGNQRSHLSQLAKSSKNRIRRVEGMKKETWKELMN